MAADIHIGVLGPATPGDVRDQLREVTEGDISQTSPITAGVPEAGVYETDNHTVHVRVEGHDGQWTLTSERAVCRALEEIHPEVEVSVVEGGYESGNGE
jgi:hypothetical protein